MDIFKNKELVEQLINSSQFRKDWAEGQHSTYMLENLNRYDFVNCVEKETLKQAIISAVYQLSNEMRKDFIVRAYPVKVEKIVLTPPPTTEYVEKGMIEDDGENITRRVFPNQEPTVPKFVDKLFKGAPLVWPLSIDGLVTECVRTFQYKNKEEYYIMEGILDVTSGFNEAKLWKSVRLPTVDEAPKNMWLIPWDEVPKELKEYPVFVKFKNGVKSYYPVHSITFSLMKDVYNNIEKIMLLE